MASSSAWDWINLAETDARSAHRLLEPPPETNTATYHVQQAAEKAIKSLLVHQNIAFARGSGRGHDLALLAGQIPAGQPLKTMAHSISHLTPWSTAYRYPSDDPFTAPLRLTATEINRELEKVDLFIAAVKALLPDLP